MLTKIFYNMVVFFSNKKYNPYNLLRFKYLQFISIRQVKKFIKNADTYDIVSEFIQFSDLYYKYRGISIPMEQIKIYPEFIIMNNDDTGGRKVCYSINENNIKYDITVTVCLKDKYKTIDYNILDKVSNVSTEGTCLESLNKTDKLCSSANIVINGYTEYAVIDVIRYGLEEYIYATAKANRKK